MRVVDLKELRQIQLEILDDIHRFCVSESIKYSLCFGTLLGAIRHKGYIPWDDDIDIMMPREDYEKFVSSYKSNKNEICDLRKHSPSVEIGVKVCRKNTIMTDLALGRSMWGINIDIFAIDGVPSDIKEHYNNILRMRKTLSRICPFYRVVGKNRFLWFVKYLTKRLIYPYFGTVPTLKQAIDSKSASFPLHNSAYGGVIIGGYGLREILPVTVFETYCDILFEGRTYMSIADYDTYLSAIYGNYMQLPPEEKRVTHHLYDVFIED